ncbi:MAG: response regulator [Clostridiaceae bacterium]|nr:response regulator [Clostridiaceae bacterium]MDY3072871.1 response regulator [Eubacteriales bacterium]MDY3287248.1 response regulator [Eubacteriales bacterium]MDY5015359.1 response regulator [Eubacteriales bacterium]
MAKILIVEDEAAIADIVAFNLEREKHEVEAVYDGLAGLERAQSGEFDLILLDVMLPGMDGFEICRRVREKSSVPIIMLTAREEETDKVFGLEIGADDYITKPFSMRELLARVQANLRRTQRAEPDVQKPDLEIGDIAIYEAAHDVKRCGTSIDLTAREFALLKTMASAPDRAFSREELLSSVWGYEYYGDLRAVDVAVRRLREKLEEDPASPKYIVTRRGVGYYFASPN